MKKARPHKALRNGSRSRSIIELLGPPALLPGEDSAKYKELQARVFAALKPRHAVEEIFARDIADLAWEVARGRRLKEHLLRACAPAGLQRVLAPLIGQTEAAELAQAWAKGTPDAKAEVVKHLARAQLTIEAVTAETLTVKLDQIERFEAMIASGEARLAAAMQEIDRHRKVCAELFEAVDEIIDAEFSSVEPQKGLPASVT